MAYILRGLKQGYIDIGGDAATIIVAGSPRSGTTWVGDVIADATSSRIIFEPFLLDKSHDFVFAKVNEREEANVEHDCSLYIPASTNAMPMHDVHLHHTLSGKVCSHWTEQQAAPGIYLRRLIKAVRFNLMAGYIAKHWPHIPIIVVIRNPLDVVESQLRRSKQGWFFDANLDCFTRQKKILSKYPVVSKIINSASNLREKRLCVRWVIESMVVMNEAAAFPNVLFITYESLTTGVNKWSKIGIFLEKFGVQCEISKDCLDTPSFTSDPVVKDNRVNSENKLRHKTTRRYLLDLFAESGLDSLFQDINLPTSLWGLKGQQNST